VRFAQWKFTGAVALLGVVSAASPVQAVDYADGGVHVISTPVQSTSNVLDGPGGIPTTVHVLAGGSFPELNVRGSSRVNFFPGSAVTTELQAFDSASVYIVGGTIRRFDTADNATGYVTAGDFTMPVYTGSRLRAFDDSTLYVTGGTFQRSSIGSTIAATSGGTVRFCGGTVLPDGAARATITASGGAPNSRLEISGGNFADLVVGSNDDVAVVYGNGFVARDDDGSIALTGYGDLPRGFSGVVTGSFANGAAIEFTIRAPLSQFTTISLAPPNPTNCVIPAPPTNPVEVVDVPLPPWAFALLALLFAAVSRRRLQA